MVMKALNVKVVQFVELQQRREFLCNVSSQLYHDRTIREVNRKEKVDGLQLLDVEITHKIFVV